MFEITFLLQLFFSSTRDQTSRPRIFGEIF